MPWCSGKASLVRHALVLAVCVLLGWLLASIIGVLLYRSSLSSRNKEFALKCDNHKEILRSEVENSLNASFVILGLLAGVPSINNDQWRNYTRRTLFLRPNVKTLVYCERVLASQRVDFERKHNATIKTILANGTWLDQSPQDEYAPIVFETEDVELNLYDVASSPILSQALFTARDTGLFTLSPPSPWQGSFQMGAYLAYYGPGRDSSTFPGLAARKAACLGYVATVLNIVEVFGAVLSRFIDNKDMDVVAVYNVDPTTEPSASYNCSRKAAPCVLPLFDPANRSNERSSVFVPWEVGTQNFELRCLPKSNMRLDALRSVVAWPLLMALVVLFSAIIVYLMLKRMMAIEKDVSIMERMNEKLTAATMAAEAADKAKSSFLATVSHEIRTPMNGVIGMTNLLMGTELTPQQFEYVNIAQASGKALLALINDVLDLSKIEAGKMEIESVKFDIRNEVDEIFSLFDEKVSNKQLEMMALIHDAVPPCLMGDPTRIRQVLVNLVSNAMKFTKQGSIFICVRILDTCHSDRLDPPAEVINQLSRSKLFTLGSVSGTQVVPKSPSGSDTTGRVGSDRDTIYRGGSTRLSEMHLVAPRLSMGPGPLSTREAVAAWRRWEPKRSSETTDLNPVTVVISIEDTGIGIPLHLHNRLFQPFLQADSSNSREYGGTGVGLSICKKLATLMNGELTVNSTPGEGSIFEFTLTLGRAPEPKCTETTCCPRPTQLSASEHDKLKGARVILVDTHPVRQEASASYLRRLGIVVEETEDLHGTLELLGRKETHLVQAIIVDLQGVDQDLTRKIGQFVRMETGYEAIPIIALTCVPPHEEELKEAGYSSTILKPLRHATVATILLQAFGVRKKMPTKKVNANPSLLAGKRLLVVDDNMVNRRVATSMLARYGATVVAVNGGPEAITAVRSQKPNEAYDLVLMDIQMPEMDGYEATRQIRKWEMEVCEQCSEEIEALIDDDHPLDSELRILKCPHHHLPIVAVTADVMKGTHELCVEAGMDDYISKPLDQKQLYLLLEHFVEGELGSQMKSGRSE
ncbi:hypothetical protein M758_9G014700 [Ceratodon purpureus]|nr:hypothetical protein M758_9G014700 [Ceratodon purpureus]